MASCVGCLTCRTKKVKCDEQAPECRRCQRLDLRCEWTRATGKSRVTANSRRRERTALPNILPKIDMNAVDFQDDLLGLFDGWPLSFGTFPPSSNEDPRRHVLSGDGGDLPLSEYFASCFSPEDWFPELALPFDSTNVQREPSTDETEISTSATLASGLSSFVTKKPYIIQNFC